MQSQPPGRPKNSSVSLLGTPPPLKSSHLLMPQKFWQQAQSAFLRNKGLLGMRCLLCVHPSVLTYTNARPGCVPGSVAFIFLWLLGKGVALSSQQSPRASHQLNQLPDDNIFGKEGIGEWVTGLMKQPAWSPSPLRYLKLKGSVVKWVKVKGDPWQ